jgi:hypothetical protein
MSDLPASHNLADPTEATNAVNILREPQERSLPRKSAGEFLFQKAKNQIYHTLIA